MSLTRSPSRSPSLIPVTTDTEVQKMLSSTYLPPVSESAAATPKGYVDDAAFDSADVDAALAKAEAEVAGKRDGVKPAPPPPAQKKAVQPPPPPPPPAKPLSGVVKAITHASPLAAAAAAKAKPKAAPAPPPPPPAAAAAKPKPKLELKSPVTVKKEKTQTQLQFDRISREQEEEEQRQAMVKAQKESAQRQIDAQKKKEADAQKQLTTSSAAAQKAADTRKQVAAFAKAATGSKTAGKRAHGETNGRGGAGRGRGGRARGGGRARKRHRGYGDEEADEVDDDEISDDGDGENPVGESTLSGDDESDGAAAAAEDEEAEPAPSKPKVKAESAAEVIDRKEKAKLNGELKQTKASLSTNQKTLEEKTKKWHALGAEVMALKSKISHESLVVNDSTKRGADAMTVVSDDEANELDDTKDSPGRIDTFDVDKFFGRFLKGFPPADPTSCDRARAMIAGSTSAAYERRPQTGRVDCLVDEDEGAPPEMKTSWVDSTLEARVLHYTYTRTKPTEHGSIFAIIAIFDAKQKKPTLQLIVSSDKTQHELIQIRVDKDLYSAFSKLYSNEWSMIHTLLASTGHKGRVELGLGVMYALHRLHLSLKLRS